MGKVKNIIGDKYNKLEVIGFSHVKDGRSYWNVKCDCGKVYTSRSDVLKINKNGCNSHLNSYEDKEEYFLVDVSTEKYPDTYTKVYREDYYEYMIHGSWWAVKGTGLETYVQGYYNGKQVSLHQLISGSINEDSLVTDHINGCGLDNRSDNLRKVNRTLNARNIPKPNTNTTGFIGVSITKSGKYRAYITLDNKQKHLGHFDLLEDAVSSRKEAEVKYGFHENHGR